MDKLKGTISAKGTITGSLSAGSISGIPPDYMCATDEDINQLFETIDQIEEDVNDG